jgi:TIR domain-containing protein
VEIFFSDDRRRHFGRSALRSIFINYRRNDSEGEAGRLFDDLVSQFSDNSVFMDVAAIEPGRDFRKAIDQSVANCNVLLAIIGLEWLEVKDAAGGRRLDDPNDFVRIELASALRRDIPVIPVLVRGAKMPQVEQLPDDLKELAYRNAVELTHPRWKSDVQVLIRALRPFMDEPRLNGTLDDKEPERRREEPTVAQPSGNGGNHATGTTTIDTQTMERISQELATYIGPIAEVVVRRAARRCSSTKDLCDTVAREIEFESDRIKFLRSCK